MKMVAPRRARAVKSCPQFFARVAPGHVQKGSPQAAGMMLVRGGRKRPHVGAALFRLRHDLREFAGGVFLCHRGQRHAMILAAWPSQPNSR